MQIDYTHSQLPEDELAEYLERARIEAVREHEAEKKRWAKMRDFRFSGGML